MIKEGAKRLPFMPPLVVYAGANPAGGEYFLIFPIDPRGGYLSWGTNFEKVKKMHTLMAYAFLIFTKVDLSFLYRKTIDKITAVNLQGVVYRTLYSKAYANRLKETADAQ